MQKTIEIDGKKITFESRGSTPLRYRKQFGSDFFADIMKLGALEGLDEEPTYEQLQSIDMDVLYNITWVLAKTADSSIPEPIEWLDQFEEFPLFDILGDIQELILSSLSTRKK